MVTLTIRDLDDTLKLGPCMRARRCVKTLLDTPVVSELMRPRAPPAVSTWVRACDHASLWMTSVTQARPQPSPG